MSEREHDIFTKRGITPPWMPEGHVARAQGFERYEGADWIERRASIAKVVAAYGGDDHPDMAGKRGEYRTAAICTAWSKRLGRRVKGLDDLPGFGVFKGYDPACYPPEILRYSRFPEFREAARALSRMDVRARAEWIGFLRGALATHDGWVMPRHSPLPESDWFGPDPMAQLRPDVPAFGHFEEHDHAALRSRTVGREEVAPRIAHESKVCDPGIVGHPANVEHPDGDFLPSGHLHPLTGDVVVPIEGPHRHWHDAKYLYTPGRSARRLGTNPLSLESNFDADDLFVFVMEGTLKMCAVTEAGFPAIDSGSIHLWDSAAPDLDFSLGSFRRIRVRARLELEEFAALHLRGRPVAVVCDSDWHRNSAVLEQTNRVTAILRDAGARAVACAPPEGDLLWTDERTGLERRVKRGVDDWLGEALREGRNRHDAFLDCIFHERIEGAVLTADHPALSGRRAEARESAAALALALGEDASPTNGTVTYSKQRMAEILGRPERTVQRARDLLDERGIVDTLTLAAIVGRGPGEGFYTAAPLLRLIPEALPKYRSGTLREWLSTLK